MKKDLASPGSLPPDPRDWPREVNEALDTLERYGVSVIATPLESMSPRRKAIVDQLLSEAMRGDQDSRLHAVREILTAISHHRTESPAFDWITRRLSAMLNQGKRHLLKKLSKGDRLLDYPLFENRRGRLTTPERKNQQRLAWVFRNMIKDQHVTHEELGIDKLERRGFDRDAQAQAHREATIDQRANEHERSDLPWGNITGELRFHLHSVKDNK
jgi:hypothetical protein